jgi:coenzyme F420-0:L-glutamate ligase / coenzyme F420-1:gamma-L-glutamate ligase
MITATAIEGLPEIEPGFDLAAAIARLATIEPGDVVVIAHKAVSKSEGRTRRLSEVTPGPEAGRLAAIVSKDPRLVQIILDGSRQVIRAVPGVLIVETTHGFICANAGVDASNSPGQDTVVVLPLDPDASARRIRARLRELTGVAPGIVITDSFGRAWRSGQCDIAIGVAGLGPLEDWRGRPDADGRELHATLIAVADELAAAADLARLKDAAQPAVIVRGAGRHVTEEDGPGAVRLIRAPEQDLFR